MSHQPSHPVTPGGLSEQDHDRIHALADKGWASTKIARAILKHPSTVYWYMCGSGLITVKQVAVPKVFARGDRVVRRFGRDEDAFIVALRLQDCSARAIADFASKRFGYTRSPHSVACRLAMLAALEESSLQEVA